MIKGNEGWSLSFNNVQKEGAYEKFSELILTVLFETFYTALDFPLPSTKVSWEYFLFDFH